MQLPPLNPPALLQFLVTVLLIASTLLFILRTAASRYFAVDDAFEPEDHGYRDFQFRSSMSIGRRGGDGESQNGSANGTVSGKCVSCGKLGSKVCSRCKSVRYCSQSCQSKHWKEDHKYACRKKEFGSMTTSTSGHCVLKVLFPYDVFVRLYNWNNQVFPPCGLSNCGNSCFANVVLQCLACTRPLVAYLLEGTHSRECRRNSWCILCELQFHIQRVTRNVQPFSPMNILSQLPNISSNLGYGRQEDAHEFMRFVIDTMQSVCLDEHGGEKALAPITQETTLIQHIFGGHLQSQVICSNCNMTSNRYENMMDLTVEIQGDVESLEDCLDQFTVKEWLDGENMYQCDGCNDYVKAWKHLTVHQAPNILTVALKRFQSGRFGKLNKRVTFPETLELSPYMSDAGNESNTYKLFAVVVHLDMLNASFFGHYICYTKDFSGTWYMIDDCKVIKVEVQEVLSQGAYMLLYSRLNVRQHKPLEVIKEAVLLQKPFEVAISGISNSSCSCVAENLPIKCITCTKSVEMDVERVASKELNNETLNKVISTSMDKCFSSEANMTEVDADGSLQKSYLEENGSPNMTNVSLELQHLPYSQEATFQKIPAEINRGVLTPGEQNPRGKADGLETEANDNFHEAPSLEQNASIISSNDNMKLPLCRGETTNEMTGVHPLSIISETSPESEGSNSGQAERESFKWDFEIANAAPKSQKTKISSSSALASKSNTTLKTEKKLLFTRGFLNKPSKRQVVSEVRDERRELSFTATVKKEAGCRERSEWGHATSWGKSNLHILSDVAKDHAETMNLSREGNGQTENGIDSSGKDDILKGYREPQPICQTLSQNPIPENGKVFSTASDHPLCLYNPASEAGTLLQVHGDDSPNGSTDCMVEAKS